MNINEILNSVAWGGSGIERETFEFIFNRIPPGSKILEIGSGFCSTKVLSMVYNLYTIEENKSFVNQHDKAHYIYAPLVNGWYSREILKAKLPSDYTFVFVDGPAGEEKRLGMLQHLDLFNKDASYLVHDTYRTCDHKLAEELGKRLNKQVKFHAGVDNFAYIW